MASRLRLNPRHLFDLFVEICCSKDGEPFIRLKYPDSFMENDVLKQLPMFAFPCEIDSRAVEHFTFTLTDVEGKHRFGFCRLSAGGKSCLCFVSWLPWFDAFYKILNKVSELFKNPEDDSRGIALLSALLEAKVPAPGEKCFVASHDGSQEMQFEAPMLDRLPSLFQDRNLMEYCSVLDYNSLITVFASMLNERRLIFTSLKISRLSACVHACASLLYPMHWQHIFLPVLPRHLLDFCSAPMPYLIGVHAYLKDDLKKMDIGDAVLVDADRNEVITPHSDVEELPHEVYSALKKQLKVKAGDDSTARAFLRSLVILIGGYQEGAKQIGGRLEFNPTAFLASRPASMRPYLEKMLNLQIFQQFVDDRLSLSNKLHGICDEFEKEVTLWQTKSPNVKYKDFVAGAKKIQKEGKDQISGLASKVRSKGRSAVKSLKRRLHEENKVGVSAAGATRRPQRMNSYKQSMLDELDHGGAGSIRHGGAGNMRRGGAGIVEKRPPRPPLPNVDGARRVKNSIGEILTPNRRESYKEARLYRPMYFDEDDLVAPRVSINLMEDPEIQSVVKKSYSLEDLVGAGSTDDNDSSSESDGSRDLLSEVVESEDVPDAVGDVSGSPAAPVAPPRRRRHNVSDTLMGSRLDSSSSSIHSGDDSNHHHHQQHDQQHCARSTLGGRGGGSSSSAPDLMGLLSSSCLITSGATATVLPAAATTSVARVNLGPIDDAAESVDLQTLTVSTGSNETEAATAGGSIASGTVLDARPVVVAQPQEALTLQPSAAKATPPASRRMPAPRIEQLQRELIERVQQPAVAGAAASNRRQVAASYDLDRLREALASSSETGLSCDRAPAAAMSGMLSSSHPLRPVTMFGRNKDFAKRQTIFGDPRHFLTPAEEDDDPQVVTFACGPSSLVKQTVLESQQPVSAAASACTLAGSADTTSEEVGYGSGLRVHEDLIGLQLDLPVSSLTPSANAQSSLTVGSHITAAKPNYYVSLPPATAMPPIGLPPAGGPAGPVPRQPQSSMPNKLPSGTGLGSYATTQQRSLPSGVTGSPAYGAASPRVAVQQSDPLNVQTPGSQLLSQPTCEPLKPKRLHHNAKPGAAVPAADPFADLVNLKSHLGVGRSGAPP